MSAATLLLFRIAALLISSYMVIWQFTSSRSKPVIDTVVQLTVISLMSINTYYVVTLIQDIKNLRRKKPIQNELPYGAKTYIFFQTIFTLAHVVAVAYWGLRLYNVELVVPKSEIPLLDWRSSYTHGINLIPLYIELVFFTQSLPKGKLWKVIHYFELTVSYWVLQYVYFLFTGKQVYPFLSALPLWVVGAFYGTLFVFLLNVDLAGCFLIACFHGKRVVQQAHQKVEEIKEAKKRS